MMTYIEYCAGPGLLPGANNKPLKFLNPDRSRPLKKSLMNSRTECEDERRCSSRVDDESPPRGKSSSGEHPRENRRPIPRTPIIEIQ